MDDDRILPCRVWKLTPIRSVESEAKPQPQVTTSATASDNAPPVYEQETSCSCTHHDTETKDGGEDFGTTVIEVTTVTKTTRKKYRVTDE